MGNEFNEPSIISDNFSNLSEEIDFEEDEIEESTTATNRTLGGRMMVLHSVYEGRPETIFF